MSIIIRLQNLPLTAKSADIRQLFRGLRIPIGGVHIVGGEKGDAFIAFDSDEDARIAMRKDGSILMDSRIKLHLSSYMEMQHEIERITKEYPDVPERLSPQRRLMISSPSRIRERSVEKGKRYSRNYRSPSPSSYRDGRRNSLSRRSRLRSRSRSPNMRLRSPRLRSRSPGMRLRSPRLRSRSRRRSRTPRRSSVGRSRSSFSRLSNSPLSRRSISPYSRSRSSRRSRSFSPYHSDSSRFKNSYYSPEKETRSYSYKGQKHEDPFKTGSVLRDDAPRWPDEEFSMSRGQAQLEKKITEALKSHYEPPLTTFAHEYIDPALGRGLQENSNAFLSSTNEGNTVRPFAPSNGNFINPPNFNERFPTVPPPTTVAPMPPPGLPPMNIPPPIQGLTIPPPMPVGTFSMPVASQSIQSPPVNPCVPLLGLYVVISGLDPNWNFTDVQEMLRGTFVPLHNIKWEIDDHGLKTGTTFIKLLNKEDFDQLLSCATYIFRNRMITVSDCPTCVIHRYFLPEWPPKAPMDPTQNNNYYRMKGLPYLVTYEDVMSFFQGLDVVDLYIERKNDGKATGIGYVAFSNINDFQEAFKMDGKKIGTRYIHLTVSTRIAMLKLKGKNGDLLSQGRILVSSNAGMSPQNRPLCAVFTGLPPDITPLWIKNYFNDIGLKPDAVHITLNDKGRPNSRAYAEFNNVREFESALKCHGTHVGGTVISVKQILYEEMMQILNHQRSICCFGSRASSSNIPEKVPYLWQPPDDVNQDLPPPRDLSPSRKNYNRTAFGRDSNVRGSEVQIFEYGNRSGKPTEIQDNMSGPEHIQHQSFDSREHDNSYPFRDELFQNENMFSSKPKFISGERGDMFFSPKDDSDRIPVKFEVKTKQHITKKNQVDDAFDRTLKPEYKKKLTKLSPERSSVTIVKSISNKNEKRKDKSSAEASRIRRITISSERSAGKTENFADVFFSPRDRSKSDKTEPKYRNPNPDERRREILHLKSRPARSSSPHGVVGKHSKFGKRNFNERGETVVQINNVHPSIEGSELADFLRDFEIDNRNLIRRIERGVPTSEIRVTFRSYREAARAIRTLDGSFLNGMPIQMFYV
ncbi:hypothetical protein CDAR_610221 [Caerostris darwini]|uniref:RRM domain-containing protein n=1 Tax=Caerostris darwini TaxID=1538125 RepID=A0AAV4N8D4_9ARAC|nr:hypothetical protein CDAR_610221 [Caerostris darwini]